MILLVCLGLKNWVILERKSFPSVRNTTHRNRLFNLRQLSTHCNFACNLRHPWHPSRRNSRLARHAVVQVARVVSEDALAPRTAGAKGFKGGKRLRAEVEVTATVGGRGTPD